MIPLPSLLLAVRDCPFDRADGSALETTLGRSRFEIRQAIDRASYQRLLIVKPDGKIVLTSQGLAVVGRPRPSVLRPAPTT